MSKKKPERILRAIHAEPWLITQEWMDRILEIANRENELTPDMISAFKGRQSGREYMVTMFDDTAVLDVQGPVMRYANFMTMFSGATATETVSTELARLANDDSVARVITRYDTPGGMASGAAEMSTQIQNFSKPVIAFATGMCCSLGYFWAAQSDGIVVSEDAIVGCIGTRTSAPDGQSDKDVVSRHAPAKIMSRGAVQDVVDKLEEVFLKHVAIGRGVEVEHVIDNFGGGGVFVGEHAVAAGLADSVGTLDSILGGSFPAGKSARRRAISPSSQPENSMSDDKKDGFISEADHKQAVKDARQEGYDNGKKAAEDAAQTGIVEAVSAERERCCAIFEAGQKKPFDSVAKLARNEAISLDDAKDIIEGFPDGQSLTNMMSNSNPNISNGAGDGDETDQSQIDDSWAKASKKAAGAA